MKKIIVHYYAALREKRGLAKESLMTEAVNAGKLYEEIDMRYQFLLSKQMLKVAINDEFATWSTRIQEGDEIVFVPPVAGG